MTQSSPATDQPSMALPSGRRMPMLGLGTWPMKGEECERAVAEAIALGYRHIDTAMMYGNHRDIARAIAASGVPRDALFITSKVWRDRLRDGEVQDDCARAADELGIDRLDLYLVHWPNDAVPIAETMAAMADARARGLTRDIGVSNFTSARVAAAADASSAPLAMNQVEYHPYLNQEELRGACAARGIGITAYSPLAKGQVADDELLRAIGRVRGMSASQVALRWLIEKGIACVPKAAKRERLAHNLAVVAQRLEPEDVRAIDARRDRRRLVDWDIAGFDR